MIGGQATDTAGTWPSILVVDDSASTRLTLRALLDDEFAVHCAHNGSDGLDIAIRLKPDLILLDVVMPGMDGYEVCRRLKAEPGTADIPVIFVTVKDDDEADGFARGAVDFIAKPFCEAVVRQRVRTHVGLKHRRDRLRDVPLALGLDLHDRHAQLMTGLLLQLDALRHALTTSPAGGAPLHRYVDRAAELARESIDELRHTVRGLRVTADADESLADAISRAIAPTAAGTPLRARIEQRGVAFALPPAAVHALTRVAEEAATNAARHGRAANLDVSIVYAADRVDISIRDDGCGFDPLAFDSGRHRGLGLRGMSERIASVGGDLVLSSAPSEGTLVAVRLPRSRRAGTAS